MREKSTLYLMLFVATGALADPVQGVATVERFCDSKTGEHFGTTETTVGRGFMSSLEQPRTVAPNLGLLRTHADNCAGMQIHPLTRDPRGTVIGSLPKTSPSITDAPTHRASIFAFGLRVSTGTPRALGRPTAQCSNRARVTAIL